MADPVSRFLLDHPSGGTKRSRGRSGRGHTRHHVSTWTYSELLAELSLRDGLTSAQRVELAARIEGAFDALEAGDASPQQHARTCGKLIQQIRKLSRSWDQPRRKAA